MPAARHLDPPLDAPEARLRLERVLALARRTRRDPARGRRQAGSGIEPGARRPAVAGDDPRTVDWPAYARLEQLLVKVPEALPPSRLVLAVDASASLELGTPPPLGRALLAAAARAAAALARGVRVDLAWGPRRLRLEHPAQLARLLAFLGAGGPPGDAFPGLASLGGRGRGELCLISDGLSPEELVEAARAGRGRGFTPSVLLVEAEHEAAQAVRSAAAEASRVQLVDAETGALRWADLPAAAWRAAADARRERLREAERALERARVPRARLRVEDPFEAPALQWLTR